MPLICQYLQIKLKLHLLLFNPSTWYICDVFLFHIQIEGKRGWIIGGGGRGPALTPPPSSYAYVICVLWDRNNQYEWLILLVGERHVLCMERGEGRRGHSRKQELFLSQRDHLNSWLRSHCHSGLQLSNPHVYYLK